MARQAVADETTSWNSSGSRLWNQHAIRTPAGKLASAASPTPPTPSPRRWPEYRMVCRGCHPTMHNGAPLECPRCHMPKRPAQDALQMSVTDHRIQRPL